MKKNINNQNIESFINIMSNKDSFVVTTKMPHAIRQAIRINLKTLTERMDIYNEGRRDLFTSFVKDGKATANETTITFKEDYIQEINNELTELALVDNEIEIETIKKDILDSYLENNDLTLAEEDVLLFFAE